MGIIILAFFLAQFLASSPNQVVPEVLGANTQVDYVSKKQQTILELEKLSENKILNPEIKKLPTSPLPAPQITTQNTYSEQILSALNSYRQKNVVGTVQSDQKLCNFAQNRAEEQARQGGLDSHKGFNDYLGNKDHFAALNVHGIGENSSWNYDVSAKELIETVFSGDIGHQKNQLNPDWTLACAGVSGKTVDIIFGKR